MGEQLVRVSVTGAGQRGAAPDLDAGLMLAEPLSLVGIEAGKVEETQGSSVDVVAAFVVGQFSAVQVPVGHVVGRIAQNVEVWHYPVHEIHPPLVDEVPGIGGDHTVRLQALGPPVEQIVRTWASLQGDKAQVVGARDQDVGLGGPLPVAG
jgi:hypothetical protein